MRVLVVTTWYPSALRPTEAPFNREHVDAIRRRHDVLVVHVRLGRAEGGVRQEYRGTPVIRAGLDPRRPWSVLTVARLVTRALRSADLLHTMAFSSILVAAPARLRYRRPWVHTEHWSGVTRPHTVSPLWQRLAFLRYLLRLPDELTAVTSQLAGTLRRYGRRHAVSVVPCVVSNDRPVAAYPPPDPLRLVAVGALSAGKRPLLAVETVARLVELGHDVHLTWVGAGPLESQVRRACSALDVADRVALVGAVAPECVFSYLDQAHLFFLPTLHENFLTSAAEALSAGRPVVLPAVGGFTDYVDETNGVLVDGDAPDMLAEAVLRAARRFLSAEPAAVAAPIRARFSPATVADQFDAVYSRAGTRRRSGQR